MKTAYEILVGTYNEAYYRGLTASKSDFAEKVGVSRTAMSCALNGKDEYLTDSLMRKVRKAFPELMEEDNITPQEDGNIRYWMDIDATGGGVQLFPDGDTGRTMGLSLPEFRDCSDAVNLYGDSMDPTYPSGSIIILRKWEEAYIDFGLVYLIVTDGGHRMVKRIVGEAEGGSLVCRSDNPAYGDFRIARDSVVGLWLVKGHIVKSAL